MVPDDPASPRLDGDSSGPDDWSPTVCGVSEARDWLRHNAPSAAFDCAPLSAEMSVLKAMIGLHAHRGHGTAPWKAQSLSHGIGMSAVVRAIQEHLHGQRGAGRDEDGSVHFCNRQSERLFPRSVSIPRS